MSGNYNPDCQALPPKEPLAPELPSTTRYPICPKCGCNTIVVFTPPRDGIVGTEEGYRLLSERSPDYVDWSKAHLYCCNGQTNCDVSIPLMGGLMTPVGEKRRRFSLISEES